MSCSVTKIHPGPIIYLVAAVMVVVLPAQKTLTVPVPDHDPTHSHLALFSHFALVARHAKSGEALEHAQMKCSSEQIGKLKQKTDQGSRSG